MLIDDDSYLFVERLIEFLEFFPSHEAYSTASAAETHT
jgi:hypothetical protein